MSQFSTASYKVARFFARCKLCPSQLQVYILHIIIILWQKQASIVDS